MSHGQVPRALVGEGEQVADPLVTWNRHRPGAEGVAEGG